MYYIILYIYVIFKRNVITLKLGLSEYRATVPQNPMYTQQ